MSRAERIRTWGYGVSSISVLSLGAVSWHSVREHPVMRWVLVVGVIAALTGMALRWASHRAKKDSEEQK